MESSLALLQDPAAWAALATLVAMEIVLGIDNLIFISILTNKLPLEMREKARKIGISLALLMRLGLLATIAIIVKLTEPVFTILGQGLSWRDIILLAGGAFLVWKATREIHHHVTADEEGESNGTGKVVHSFSAAIGQILLLDLVFSIDSIITAVGMTEHVQIMFVAVIAAVMAMLFAATPLANFINRNPTIVMLALAFLMMIGMTLIAEGLGHHVPKGYIYTAMAFSAAVEGLNMLARQRRQARRARGEAP
ncbi:TerC family protein [Cupriavidus oxalaticus]|jgi:predicted tellurium resistance membrane protein TerC|uniref:Membrane protein possibly involved in tellurium resistance n=1 Tax=Cupriavidus oxalaticus TaxID=96344 RepID=A0A375FX11_9BURK|nr:TerC family protein [Cupriavidus oxalaticus]QEZ43360.1 TerC family protein [Cupriavidus oxalaticus]QRQ85249.1 TerC family protein [Cupriavidus oxalaticus]QRQ90663.1 TerC family protein [Cupriavidus oxalaticus]WQD85188.1 TerC family protein [Cupriavidus oxalaticus]SPC10079.1 Membrane protein possibly involved in tellurium resistance [Cupriavidus oxalaticus]